MRYGTVLAFIFAASLSAQSRVNTQPSFQGSFGNVVFPGGTSAIPGVQRNFGNVVYPGTGGPKLNVPFSITDPTFGDRLGRTIAGQNVFGRQFNANANAISRSHRGARGAATYVPYAYPVYVGGGYGYGYGMDGAAQQQPAPNITVIYPPQQSPVIMMAPDQGQLVSGPAPDTTSFYQAPVRQPAEAPASTTEPTRYLIAFRDHTIYSAVAYWVEGDTLHYFTNGNTHNQVSLSLIDKDLTERLNKESGAEVRLPK